MLRMTLSMWALQSQWDMVAVGNGSESKRHRNRHAVGIQAPKRDGERRQSLLIATPQHCLQRVGRRANRRGSVKVSSRLALLFFVTASQHAQVCLNCRSVCMGAVRMMVVGAKVWVTVMMARSRRKRKRLLGREAEWVLVVCVEAHEMEMKHKRKKLTMSGPRA